MVKGKRGDFKKRTLKAAKKAGLDLTEDFTTPVKRPRQERLPGTEDAKIDALEDAAQDYAAVRDQRQRFTAKEVELKGKLLDLMKKNEKETYKRDGVEIKIVHEEETVKVKIKKDEGE